MTDAGRISAAIAAFEAETGRTLDQVEAVQATQRARNALVVIRARLGFDLIGVADDSLVYVLGQILLARAQNPEGYQSESIDDYTYRLGSETRRITILDEWWDVLQPRRHRRRAFSVMPS